MKQELKRHLVSALITFVATFALFFFGALKQETFEFSKDAVIATAVGGAVAGMRAAAKIIYELVSNLLSNAK